MGEAPDHHVRTCFPITFALSATFRCVCVCLHFWVFVGASDKCPVDLSQQHRFTVIILKPIAIVLAGRNFGARVLSRDAPTPPNVARVCKTRAIRAIKWNSERHRGHLTAVSARSAPLLWMCIAIGANRFLKFRCIPHAVLPG